MNIKKIIRGLKQFSEGLDIIMSELESLEKETMEDTEVSESATESTTTSKASKSTKVSDKTVKEKAETTSDLTEEELKGMTYNDLKKLAKEMGISAVGNRKELMSKLLNGEFTEEVEDDDEVEETVAPKKTSKPVTKKKPEPPVDEEDEEEEELEEEEEEIDPVEQQVLEAVEDMEDEEIKELLEDSGISSKGKRQAMIAKLVKAVKDGKIDFDTNDNSEDEDTDSEESEEDSDDEDSVEDITATMTKKRKKAYLEFVKETEESFGDGEISREDLIEFINDFNNTKDKMKSVSDEELIGAYCTISANLIDDDGEIVEEGAYVINDEPYCCGKPLKFDEDENKFICEVCGEEYEGEEK